MDIQKIYLKQSQIYLNSSIAVLIPAIISVLIIVEYGEKQEMVLVSPFLLYSFYLFQNYLLNFKRYLVIPKRRKVEDNTDFLSYQRFILYFEKDKKELLFLHPSGEVLGKIVRRKYWKLFRVGVGQFPSEFILIDKYGRILATYLLNKGNLDVYQIDKGYIGSYYAGKKGNTKGEYQVLNGNLVGTLCGEAPFMDDTIQNSCQQIVFRLRRGWMQLEEQTLFLNPNLPILNMKSSLETEEILLYLSVVVKRFY